MRYSDCMTTPADTPSTPDVPTPEEETGRKIHGDLKDILGQLARQAPKQPPSGGAADADQAPDQRLH